MSGYQHLELINHEAVFVIRLLKQRPFDQHEVEQLVAEWNSIADRGDCRKLIVDCSNVQFLGSEMLGKLILLHRRLERKKSKLTLCGLRPELREVLSWTRLDSIFEIEEDERQEPAACESISVMHGA